MRHFSLKRLRRCGPLAVWVLLLMAAICVPIHAQEPKPDPTGAATGDRTNAVDAAGNSFAVAEPAASDPDYATKKKAFDDLCSSKDTTSSQMVRLLIRQYLEKHGIQLELAGKSPLPARVRRG